jgi:hypothetical protein
LTSGSESYMPRLMHMASDLSRNVLLLVRSRMVLRHAFSI